MTTDQVLAVLRRQIEEVDLATSTLTDEELLEHISDVRDLFELRATTGTFSGLTVGTDQAIPATYGILPAPTLEQGHLLALGAAIRILEASYKARVSRGELGASWSSGLESESTISQAKAYEAAIQKLRMDLEELILIRRSGTAGFRAQ